MSGKDGINNVRYIVVMHSVCFKARRQNEQDKRVQMNECDIQLSFNTGITYQKADAAGTPLSD